MKAEDTPDIDVVTGAQRIKRMKDRKLDELPHEKGFHISWDQMHRDSRALAWRLDGKKDWKAVLAVTRSGMIPAMIISRGQI